MTIAYWCVMAMILMPYLFNQIAKRGMPIDENRRPREFLKTLEGKAQRADWAHRNTLEALPGFIAAVIIAHLCAADQGKIDVLSATYVVLRLIYGFFYIMDKHVLRSLCWMCSFACIIMLFVISA